MWESITIGPYRVSWNSNLIRVYKERFGKKEDEEEPYWQIYWKSTRAWDVYEHTEPKAVLEITETNKLQLFLAENVSHIIIHEDGMEKPIFPD